jgi:hypothetical protein
MQLLKWSRVMLPSVDKPGTVSPRAANRRARKKVPAAKPRALEGTQLEQFSDESKRLIAFGLQQLRKTIEAIAKRPKPTVITEIRRLVLGVLVAAIVIKPSLLVKVIDLAKASVGVGL